MANISKALLEQKIYHPPERVLRHQGILVKKATYKKSQLFQDLNKKKNQER